jgi:hypothetical protein
MGDSSPQVSAPLGYGVMFVEINYDYQALFGTLYVKPMLIHYVASYVVRDTRDYSMIYNPAPTVTASTCNLYTRPGGSPAPARFPARPPIGHIRGWPGG